MAKGFAKDTKKKPVYTDGYYPYFMDESPQDANKRLGNFVTFYTFDGEVYCLDPEKIARVRDSERFKESDNKEVMLWAEHCLEGIETGKYCYVKKLEKWVRLPVSVAEYLAVGDMPDHVPLWTPMMPVFPAS